MLTVPIIYTPIGVHDPNTFPHITDMEFKHASKMNIISFLFPEIFLYLKEAGYRFTAETKMEFIPKGKKWYLVTYFNFLTDGEGIIFSMWWNDLRSEIKINYGQILTQYI